MDMKELVEKFNPDNAIGGIINQTSALIILKIKEILRKNQLDLTPEEFAILIRLWAENGIPQSKLTEKTLKDKTNVSKLIDRLTKKSLVVRRTVEIDQRNYIVYLTDKGNDIKYVVLPCILQLMDEISKGISATDIETTMLTLRYIYKNLNEI